MTPSPYLDMLDELLRPGIAGLSERFVAAQVRFVASCQQPDGGFSGRQGGSDLYFTDFTLRTLAWLAPGHAAFDRALGYIVSQSCLPRDVVECFNLLNACRILEQQVAGTTDGAGWAQQRSSPTAWLRGRVLPGGGFGRIADDDRASAYHTFLGALCFQMLGDEIPAVRDAIHAIRDLNRPGGGYAELTDQTAPQTNATAAAVGFLVMHDALPPETTARTIRFLARMQSDDGGFRPHDAVTAGDLLSTYTGLLTLSSLGGFSEIDSVGVARFLQRTAQRTGGFMACEGDDTPDVEYTYYGVGTLALLRVMAASEA